MQACQFCGAKSWGPVKDPESRTFGLSTLHRTAQDYRECDSCGQWGLVDVVLDMSGAFPGSHTVNPRFMGILPPPFDPIETAMGALKRLGIGKKDYQTRTYELVRDLLAANPREGSKQSSKEYAQWLVLMALLIEDELDLANKLDQKVSQPAFDLKPRNFQLDFLVPVMSPLTTIRVSLALDCAIAYGALEAQTGNESLKLSAQLEATYWDKVERLKASML